MTLQQDPSPRPSENKASKDIILRRLLDYQKKLETGDASVIVPALKLVEEARDRTIRLEVNKND